MGALPSLKAFGFEGSMSKIQRVNTFQPLSQLPQIQALFLTACRPAADGLRPFFGLRSLRYLEIAGHYPDADFLALRDALPQLTCGWFEEIDKFGSVRACLKAYREEKGRELLQLQQKRLQ